MDRPWSFWFYTCHVNIFVENYNCLNQWEWPCTPCSVWMPPTLTAGLSLNHSAVHQPSTAQRDFPMQWQYRCPVRKLSSSQHKNNNLLLNAVSSENLVICLTAGNREDWKAPPVVAWASNIRTSLCWGEAMLCQLLSRCAPSCQAAHADVTWCSR